MRPAPFDLIVPDTLDEALSVMTEQPEQARPLAGGQSLIPMMNLRLAVPETLVDLGRVNGLDGVELRADGTLSIGAMCRQATAHRHPLVLERAPLIAEALNHVGHWQIRTRGTVGGNLAHADPASELPAAMLALGAAYRTASTRRQRTIGAADFPVGAWSTALNPDELLVSVEIPPPVPAQHDAITEIARVAGAFALAGAAVSCLFEGPICYRCRIVAFAAGPQPVRLAGAEEIATGTRLDEATLLDVAERVASEVSPFGDGHISAEQRVRLLATVVKRALARAGARQ